MSYTLKDLKLSDTSFTNKDFNSIYPELLEKAKDLSYKWDPTVSNESDPGVTLIKEMALVLDKINYSSDKNALESMPLSVTQERTARKLFQLLGYYPEWYISSEVDLSIAWRVDESQQVGNQIKIPAFTQVVDGSGEFVYVLPEDVYLKDDGTIEETSAIQGVLKDLEINNSKLITFDLLDKNRRVYFPDFNIAQNGIFVYAKEAQDEQNINSRSYWERKDNLLAEQTNNHYFSFNVDITTGRCYLEFPIDIADLIGDGLYIKYLISNGVDGIIGINQLNALYNSSLQVTQTSTSSESTSITITTDDLYINNTDLTTSGKNPETIDQMYVNYSKIRGTFDTLITLRDYSNAVFNTKMASNAVVCDRTDDVQESYRIMAQTLDGSENVIYTQEQSSYEDGRLTPFDLKVYALQYNDLIDTESADVNKAAYDNTFQLFTDLDCENPFNIDSSLRVLTQLLNNERCVQHDFRNIESNKICLIKNVAEIQVTVFPKISLTALQRENVINDVKNQIYAKYNARQIQFGDSIDQDTLFDNILVSSNLIKNISLNQVQYYSYALYYSEGEHKTYNNGTSDYVLQDGWRQVCVSDEIDYTHMHLSTNEDGSYSVATSNNGQKWFEGAYLGWSSNEIQESVALKKIPVAEQYANNRIFLCDYSGDVYYLNDDNHVVLYSTRRNDFRLEILAKNILAGVTPLITTKSSGFNYQLDENAYEFSNVQAIDVETEITFNFDGQSSTSTYWPKDNEVIQFVRPQLKNAVNYGAYIKYDYKGQTVQANADHKLTTLEQLVIYYKTQDSDDAPYTRVEYGQGDIICPTFLLTQTTSNIQQLDDNTITPSTVRTCNASQSIAIKEINQVVLNNQINKIYVLGDEEDGKYSIKFKLLKEDGGVRYYTTTLTETQQFIYASQQLTYLNILGSGTRITIEIPTTSRDASGDTYTLSNQAVSTRNINLYGVSALDKKWISTNYKITVLAQEFVNVRGTRGGTDSSSDSYVTIEAESPISTDIVLDRDGLHYDAEQIFHPTEGYQGIRDASGLVTYTDNSGNVLSDSITDSIDQTAAFNFINGEYGEAATNDISTFVTFQPNAYIQEELSGIYEQGIGPQTLSGIVTSKFFTGSSGNPNTYYLIDGSTLYVIRDVYSGDTVVSHEIQQISGFADSLNGPLNVKIDPDQFTYDGYDGGQYTYSVSGIQLPPGGTLYLVKEDATSVGQYICPIDGGVVQQNTSGSSVTIEFPSAIRLHDTETATNNFLYTGYILNEYYNIQDIVLDYNTDASGAYMYSDPSLADGYGFDPAITSNNDNGKPCGYVTIIAREAGSGRVITFPLLQEFWKYASHQFVSTLANATQWDSATPYSVGQCVFYDKKFFYIAKQANTNHEPVINATTHLPESDEYWDVYEGAAFESTTPVTVDRVWSYLNASGDQSYIKDADFAEIFDYRSFSLTNRTLDYWVWPIQNYTATINILQNYVTPSWIAGQSYDYGYVVEYQGYLYRSVVNNNTNTPGGSGWNRIEGTPTNTLNANLFTFRYMNRGDSEEGTIVLSNDLQVGWSIYGLAYLDFVDGGAVRLYENQSITLKLPEETEVAEIAEQDNQLLLSIGEDSGLFDEIYAFCSDDLYIEGLNGLQSTKLINEDQETYYPSILLIGLTKSNDYTRDIGAGNVVTFTSNVSNKELQLKPPIVTDYIFQINNYQTLKTFTFDLQSSAFGIQKLWTDDQTTTDLKEKGVYYFRLTKNQGENLDSTITATITIEAAETTIASDMTNNQIDSLVNSIKIEILPLQMLDFDVENDVDAIGFDKVLDKVKNLSKIDGRYVFDYFYQPSEERKIVNPLQSASFNNHNHFYNPYTICKIRTYDALNDSNIFINV